MNATGALVLALSVALALAGCKREERDYRPTPAAAARAQMIALSPLQPGGSHPTLVVPNEYEESAYAVSEGQRLYRWYNCNGCHASGGGGNGPALMDDQWIYGSAPANIVATILEGRPNGMPAFGGRIPDAQLWQLVAYVLSMSGQSPIDAAPGRADHMRARTPEMASPFQGRRQTGHK